MNIDSSQNNKPEQIKVVDKVSIEIDQQKSDDLKVLLTNKRGLIEKITPAMSGLSFIISVITIAFTIWTYYQSEKKWNQMNLARVSITEVKYLTFRSITFNELRTTDWGYFIQALSEPASPTYNPNEVLVKSLLVTKDTSSRTYIQNTFSITLQELKRELIAKGYVDSTKYIYEKKIQPVVTLQNVGLTSCNIDSIVLRKIALDTANYMDQWGDTTFVEKNFTIEPGQKYINGKIAFFIPLNAPIPDIQFDYEVYFENVNHKKEIKKFRVNGGGKSDFVVRNINVYKL